MRRGIVAGAAAALVVALVGGTASVALATDGVDEVAPVTVAQEIAPVEEVAPVEQTAPIEEVAPDVVVAPVEELAPAEEVAPVEQLEPVEEIAPVEQELPEAPALAGEEDPTGPEIWMNTVDETLAYAPGSTFRVDFECHDPESGIVRCEEEHGYRDGEVITLTELGWHDVTIVAVNGAGTEVSTGTRIHVRDLSTVRVGVVASAPPTWNGWWHTPSTLTIQGVTTGPFPIREIHVKVAGVWTTYPGDRAEVLFDEEGIFEIEYYAVDEDVVPSIVRQQLVQLDFTAPRIRPQFENGAVFEQDAELLLEPECWDSFSGLDQCVSTSAYLRTSELGENVVMFGATDQAGNALEITVRYIVVAADGDPGPGDGDGDPDPEPSDDPTDLPTEADEDPAPPIVPTDVDSLAYTGVAESAPWALLAGGLILIGLALAAGVTIRRWERARD